MKKVLLFCATVLMMAAPSAAKGDLIFLVEQLGGSSPILVGNEAQFGIFLASTTFGATNTTQEQPLGVDVRVTLDTGNGSAGLWSAGANLQGGAGFDPEGFPTNSALYAAFWGNPPLTFPNADTRHQIATLTLNTAGAVAGTYSISLSELSALSAAFTEITSINGGPLQYSIFIPEPSSAALLGLAVTGVLMRRRREN
jgi:hypothetical protein